MTEKEKTYEKYVGKKVQITMLEDGKECKWQPRTLESVEDNLLYLAEGEVVDTESSDFVGLRPEPDET